MTHPVVISKSPNFQFEFDQKGSSLIIRAIGKISEEVDFYAATRAILASHAQQIAFDTTGVNDINSVGVREWVLFLDGLVKKKLGISFQVLNPIFIEHASTVRSMLGKIPAHVDSLMIPYFCEACRSGFTKSFTPDGMGQKNDGYAAPEVKCEKCNQLADFDGVETDYFNFLKYTKF